MTTPYWIRPVLKKAFRMRFALSRLTRYGLVGRVARKMLFEGDELYYLAGGRIIAINEEVEPANAGSVPVVSEVVEYFIRQAGFIWKMDFCICRDSAGCRDYPRDLGCLFMGEAARNINPGFGRPVSTNEALDHAALCRETGLVHLIGRNKLDNVWLGTGPPGKLLTVCNCCPCCCLWKVLPELDESIGRSVSRMPGIEVVVTDSCLGCGLCAERACFVGAVRVENRRAEINQDLCRGCGRCAEMCPNNAIEIRVTDPGFIEDTICRIENAVDVK